MNPFRNAIASSAAVGVVILAAIGAHADPPDLGPEISAFSAEEDMFQADAAAFYKWYNVYQPRIKAYKQKLASYQSRYPNVSSAEYAALQAEFAPLQPEGEWLTNES